MVNITHKNTTLRKAIAVAVLQVSQPETIAAIEERRVPKGDVFEFSRAAGLLAIKKTSDVIPDCHPLPVEFAAIRHQIEGLSVRIEVEVHTIYRTGVEVEAMHGAVITALTMYDMLKPIDPQVTIGQIALQSKSGGKSGPSALPDRPLSFAVVVCSDTIAAGKGVDTAGQVAIERLSALGLTQSAYEVIPDQPVLIYQSAERLITNSVDVVIFTGGTGLSTRDITPETLAPLLDTPVPGIMETLRRYGQERMPYAMLSRGVAGMSGDTLLITLPGSPKAVREAMDALFPQVLHIFKVRHGERHEG